MDTGIGEELRKKPKTHKNNEHLSCCCLEKEAWYNKKKLLYCASFSNYVILDLYGKRWREVSMEKKMMKYEKIKKILQEQIEKHELKPNQVIPSEHMLCEQYDVSRITVRKAIDELVYEGLLYRIKGKGCFVREQPQNELSHIYSYTEAIINQGKTPSKQQILLQKEPAGEELAQKLKIDKEDEVYYVKCLYLADGQPYCLNTSILPVKIFPRLECFNFGNSSLYEVLKSFFDLSMTRVQQTIIATEGTQEVNQYLGLKENKPLLKINATSYCLYNNNEIVFELYESYLITDILSYSVEKYN